MRLTAITSAVVLALSTAAIAQVGQGPEEQKLPANDTAMPDEDGQPEANTHTPAPPDAGSPSTALVNSAAGKSPEPVGQQPPK